MADRDHWALLFMRDFWILSTAIFCLECLVWSWEIKQFWWNRTKTWDSLNRFHLELRRGKKEILFHHMWAGAACIAHTPCARLTKHQVFFLHTMILWRIQRNNIGIDCVCASVCTIYTMYFVSFFSTESLNKHTESQNNRTVRFVWKLVSFFFALHAASRKCVHLCVIRIGRFIEKPISCCYQSVSIVQLSPSLFWLLMLKAS